VLFGYEVDYGDYQSPENRIGRKNKLSG